LNAIAAARWRVLYLTFIRPAGGAVLGLGIYRVRTVAPVTILALSSTNVEFEITYDPRF
jgi:hypothetical protein